MELTKHRHAILLALHNGDRLYYAGGFTYLQKNKSMRVQCPAAQALLDAGLIERDEHNYCRLSEYGRALLEERAA